MTRLPRIAAALATLIAAPAAFASGDTSVPPPHVTRVAATLNGVFSPRGFFNILVPLEHFPGVKAVKLDLKISRITIDFTSGHALTQDQMRQVMIDAGYRPGPVSIESLPETEATETGPGWMTIKHPTSGNAFGRWAQINF